MRDMTDMNRRAVIAGVIASAFVRPAKARDLGQWQNSDPETHAWITGLRRPDYPNGACCGESDAYWADDYYARDGKAYARITDNRDDGPLKRPHVEKGTEFEIPPEKLIRNSGNPTPHNWIFLGVNRQVLCFAESTGS